MKTKYILTIITLIWGVMNASAISYTWNGSVSTSYSNNNNWTPSGVPDSADNVTISSGTYNPVLDQNRKVTNLTLSNKTIDLNGFSLTVYGVATMTSGTVTNGDFLARGSLAAFNGTLMDCPVDAVCGYIRLSGSTFNEVADFTDQGLATGNGAGGCTFNDDVTITHNGTLTYFNLGGTSGDIFNQNVTFTNNSNRELNIAINSSTNFNGNVILNSTSTGGIMIGSSSGSATLASGKTISIGGSGFAADYLTLRNFTQSGSTAQTLNLTSTAVVNMISSTFNGNLTVSSPGILLKNSTFNGTSSFTRTATSGNHQSDGGNIFNIITLDNAGSTGRVRWATTTPDLYSGNATFSSSGGQDVQIAYSGDNLFSGNITINSNKVVFNTASGKVTFTGGNSQTLNGSYNYSFKKLAINKSANHVTANTTLSVDDTLFLVSKNLITTATYLLTMKHGSTASGASNSSFVSGPVKKTGNSAFQFPVGKGNYFRSVEITAPSNTSDSYTGEFFNEEQVLGDTTDTTISYLSDCNYWKLDRNTGSSNIKIQLSWDSSFCWTIDTTFLKISHWNSTKWTDLGKGPTTGRVSGTIQSLNTISSYGYFTLASAAPNTICSSVYELGTTGVPILASDILSNITLNSVGLISGNTLTTNGFNSPITIAIIGDLFIDTDFTLLDANIFMDQDVPIFFQTVNGLEFNVITSHIQGCKARDMWTGITIDGDFTNELNIYGGSVIEDAEVAINSIDGGEFHLDKAILNKNNVGIFIGPYGSNHPGTIENGSEIKCSQHHSNFIPGVLRAPFFGLISTVGIWLPLGGQTGFLQIGNPSSPSNTFFNLYRAIRTEDWNLDIFNNQFIEITDNAIFALHNYLNGSANFEINVGVGGFGNYFENCNQGILALQYSCNIENNTFIGGQTGVQVANSLIVNMTPSIVEINISNNSFTNFGSRGIYSQSTSNTDVFDIKENIFTRDINLANGTTGIWIGASAQATDNLDIRDNEFFNVRWGVLLNSVQPPANSVVKPKNVVANNTFNFDNNNVPNSNPDFWGIRMENCRGVWIGQNDFYRTNGNAANEELDMIAILANASQGCPIITNQFYDFGTGIWLRGNCANTRLRCNEFYDNFQSNRVGQNLAGATMTNQGNGSLAWDNQWDNNGATFRIEGTVNPIIWFHRTGSPYEPTNNIGITVTGGINATTTCPLSPPAIVIDRDTEIRPFIQDSVTYLDHISENRWMGLEYAYWALQDDTLLIEQHLDDDSIYVNFVNSMSTTNIGYFHEIERLVSIGEKDEALEILETITDTNTIENNLKTYFAIYLDSYALGEAPDSVDYETLVSIANQKPLDGGRAVWLIRHLLELEIEDIYDDEHRYAQIENESNVSPHISNSNLKFANPASGVLKTTSEIELLNSDLELYNSFGQMVLKVFVNHSNKEIDISHLTNGLYMYKLKTASGKQYSGKVIIANDF